MAQTEQKQRENILLRILEDRLYSSMDWQQIAALTVVAATAGIFIWTKLRRRKFSFEHDTHCGCGSASERGLGYSIVFSARKGHRPKIILKEN